jgi:hypothetical protein
MLVPQSARPQSQFNAEQSKSNGKTSTIPPVSVPCNDSQRCPVINLNLLLSKESAAANDVGTTVDKTMMPSLMLSNQIKW